MLDSTPALNISRLTAEFYRSLLGAERRSEFAAACALGHPGINRTAIGRLAVCRIRTNLAPAYALISLQKYCL